MWVFISDNAVSPQLFRQLRSCKLRPTMSEGTSPVNIKKPLKRWKVLLILNGSSVAGLIISLFTLPSNTPFWWWVAISIVWLVGINFFALRRFRKWGQEPHTLSTTNKVIMWVGVVIWFVFEILSKLFRH